MTEPVAELTIRPETGCYIHGLFLEGARWDTQSGLLAESPPKKLHTEMSVIWMLPTLNRKQAQSGIYICPIYKTLTRAGKCVCVCVFGYRLVIKSSITTTWSLLGP